MFFVMLQDCAATSCPWVSVKRKWQRVDLVKPLGTALLSTAYLTEAEAKRTDN